jgi:hypothetical protein
MFNLFQEKIRFQQFTLETYRYADPQSSLKLNPDPDPHALIRVDPDPQKNIRIRNTASTVQYWPPVWRLKFFVNAQMRLS